MIKRIALFALLAYLFAGCNHRHDTEEHKEHDAHEEHDEHEEEKIQFTAYSIEFELFVEADPFVAGQESNVLSHLSNMPEFSALESGSVTIHLIVEGKEISQTLDEPTQKGVYSFDLLPETIGVGKLLFDIKTIHGNYRIEVPDIIVYATAAEADEAADEAILSTTNTTAFTKEQSWKIDFATEVPIREAFGDVIKTTAQVQSSQGDEILVTAKSNGIIIFSTNNVLEGKSVSKDQILFSISGSGLADNSSAVKFAEAKNNFEKAKADYLRSKELAKDKIVSEKELAEAKNQFDNAKIVYDNLNENFNSVGQIVKSPMEGFVKQVFVKNGQYVESGQAIVSISQNKTLLLRAEVQQKYAPVLGRINSANIRTIHDNRTYTLEQLNGKVLSFGRNTNNDNYLIPVSLQVDNTGSFIPGSFVELYLKTITNTQALTIPNTALLEEQGNFFVFVQITPELFEKREVKTGASDGFKTEIQENISPKERIVTKGALLINLSQVTGTLDAHSGHVH